MVVPGSSDGPAPSHTEDGSMSNSLSTNPISKCNGKEERSSLADEVPQSSYQFLLKQVESLRKENCTLKAELKNNTSHISKLETEASKMKDMVYLLGSPALSTTPAEQDYCIGSQPYLPVRFHSDHGGQLMPDELSLYNVHEQETSPVLQTMKFHNGYDKYHDSARRRPELLLGLSSSYHHSPQQDIAPMWQQAALPPGTMSASPSNGLPDVIRMTLASMKNERASSLKSLTLEEQTKEFYVTKLKELTNKLDSVCESEKFSKPNDNMRRQLEHEISNLKKTMEHNLGSSDTMQERLNMRIKHLQFLESEITAMERQLRKAEMSFLSSETNSPLHGTNQADAVNFVQVHMEDMFYTQQNRVLQSDQNLLEASTQTPKLGSPPFDFKKFDEDPATLDSTVMDAVTVSGSDRISRSVQTRLTSKTGVTKVNLKSKYPQSYDGNASILSHEARLGWPEQLGSVDSLPSQSDVDDNASMHSFTTSLPRNFQSPFHVKKDEFQGVNSVQPDKEELTAHLVRMGETIEGCQRMKQMGYMSLIVQIIHDSSILAPPACLLALTSPNQTNPSIALFSKSLKDVRISMSKVLWNIINVTSETKSNQEIKIFETLQVFRRYCEHLSDFWLHSQASLDKRKDSSTQDFLQNSSVTSVEKTSHEGSFQEKQTKDEKKYNFVSGLNLVFDPPINRIAFIMKLSYEETVKRIINDYGGLHAVAELFILHYRSVTVSEMVCVSLGNDVSKPDDRTVKLFRRYVGFALINLTYGDIKNKTIMIQMPGLIDTIISQMASDSEEMQQVMALFVRNLCWKADEKCREIFKKKNMVSVFTKCALKAKREETLKSILSALWNLSGHCTENRASICSITGALAFLVSTLTCRVPEIVESGGGILKNVSSVVSSNEEYRAILREKNCLQILLTHLKSSSLTIVGNACGTLWNLSARNAQDQKLLCDLGAVPMLKNLIHSKHAIIAKGSSAALRNLLSHHPECASMESDKCEVPRLKARKQKGSEHGDDLKTPEKDEFLPSCHASSVTNPSEKLIPSKTLIGSQRYSLQENATQSPVQDTEVRKLQKAGLQYSGSLGCLPNAEFSETLQQPGKETKKYIPAARNSNSYPESAGPTTVGYMEWNAQSKTRTSGFSPVGNGIFKDIMMFRDLVPPTHNPKMKTGSNSDNTIGIGVHSPQASFSLRDYLKMMGERKSSLNSQVNKSHESGGQVKPGTAAFPHDVSRTDRSADLSKYSESSPFRPVPDVKKLISQVRNPNIVKIPKCPEDLVKQLYHVGDDYENDDGPVNYSLQYSDEHMTPGIQSPRTEEIYELAENSARQSSKDHNDAGTSYMQSQVNTVLPQAVVIGQSTKSDGGLSALSSCIESTGSSAPMRQDILKSNERVPDIDGKPQLSQPRALPSSGINFSGDRKIDPSTMNYPFEEEKPTNFSAIYSEERLYDPIEHESTRMKSYAPVDGTFQHSTNNNNSQSEVTNAPETIKSRGSDSLDANIESREEDDKFDTGAITPGHSYHYRSGRNSGIMTPRTPLEYETPMMFSRSSSLDSVSDGGSIHSSITSGPTSRMMSGAVSPSHLPDSPSQSMPISPRRSPPPRVIDTHPADVDNRRRNISLKPECASPALTPSTEAKESNSNQLHEKIEGRISKMNLPDYGSPVLPQDEINAFKSEGTMSVMTKFSSLTIDSSDKILPLGERDADLLSPSESKVSSSSASANKSSSQLNEDVTSNKNERALGQVNSSLVDCTPAGPIGYVTSLPTNDEIKTFMNEGTLSPMTAFSEITCLRDDNDGFQKSTGSVFSVANSAMSKNADGARSVASNKISFASRSSATGASVPPAPTRNQPQGDNAKCEDVGNAKAGTDMVESAAGNFELPGASQPTDLTNEEDAVDSDDTLSSCSTDDGADLLQQCINTALPKKPSRSSRGSSKHSSRSTKSSRSKDKSDKASSPSSVPSNGTASKKTENRAETNPSPVIPDKEQCKRINIRQRIESANMKLNGVSIVDYMDNLMVQSDDESENAQARGKTLKLDNSKAKQVIGDAETLSKSYSVRKKLKEDEKTQKVVEENDAIDVSTSKRMTRLPSEVIPAMQPKLKVQSYLREGFTTYATEGTPVEMSRCTSLSNITIDSDGLETDSNALSSKLKTSLSEPDISLSASKAPCLGSQLIQSTETGVESENTKEKPDQALRFLPVARGSREILESLEKQVESLSLSKTDNVTNSKGPGYTTSTPQIDEIRKYNMEGSQFGGTEFSALTIDSDTKISPALAAEVVANPPSVTQPKEMKTSNHPVRPKPLSLNPRSIEAGNGNSLKLSTLNAIADVSIDTKNIDGTAWVDPGHVHPAAHYNNDNDNLAMKEERHNYMIENTPLNLSGGSLSSLDFGSDDDNDLLNECITSALPPERKMSVPPNPVELVRTAPNDLDATRWYSHGIPDGKVDSPPCEQNPGSFVNMQARVTPGFSPEYPSLTREQFMMFQKETDALSAEIMYGHPKVEAAPTHNYHNEYNSSSSYSLTKPSDGFYNLSRQASVPDSDLSISSSVLGERQTVFKSQAASLQHTSLTSSRNHDSQRNRLDKSSVRQRVMSDKTSKPIKRQGPGKSRDVEPAMRRGRNQRVRGNDSSSESSSSYRKQQGRRHLSSNSRSTDVCSCQVSCSGPTARYNHGPVSASTSHLVDGIRPASRPRRKSTNSASKNSIRACDHSSCHHHHPPKTNRTRNSARNIYRPSVIQLYPPLKDMNGVLEGVASVAARGDKVVADRNPHYSASNMSKKSSSSSLVRSATFINETPSEILLESLTKEEKEQYIASGSLSSLSQSHQSTGGRERSHATSPRQSLHSLEQNSRKSSPRGSVHSVKSQSTSSNKNVKQSKGTKKDSASTKSKPKKVWSGIKKLLSPSDESMGRVKDGSKTKPAQSKLQKKVVPSHPRVSATSIHRFEQNVSPVSTTAGNATMVIHETAKASELSASSLSLTSSSADNDSSDADEPVQNDCLRNDITPYGLLPKSPSVNALMRKNATGIPQSRSLGLINQSSMGGGSSVWRRTPPKLSCPGTRAISSQRQHLEQVGSADACPTQRSISDAQVSSSEVWISEQSATSKDHNQHSSDTATKLVTMSKKPNEAVPTQTACLQPNGFQSPPRTQSPRVVQQVAPFNYRPIQKRTQGDEAASSDKSLPESRRINPDCKQTPV